MHAHRFFATCAGAPVVLWYLLGIYCPDGCKPECSPWIGLILNPPMAHPFLVHEPTQSGTGS